MKALGVILGVFLTVIGLVVALQLSLASFPKWQIVVVVSGVAALVLLIFVPVWQVRNLHAEDTQDMQRRVELENETRKTLAQILGGAAVLAGAFFTAQQLFVAQDAQRTAEEAQITERFTRATEQLGSDELAIRIGGIFAFHRIARDSKEDLHPIVSILLPLSGKMLLGRKPKKSIRRSNTIAILMDWLIPLYLVTFTRRSDPLYRCLRKAITVFS